MNTDTLASRILTVQTSCKCMGRTVEDADLTADTCRRHNIKKGKARVTKTLMAEPTAPILALFRHFRKEVNTLTFPGVGKTQIMAAANYPEFSRLGSRYDGKLRNLVAEFAADYPAHLQEERLIFGESFNRADYPADGQVEAAFDLTFSAAPMARPSDMVVDALTADAVAEIRTNYEAQIRADVTRIENQCITTALGMLQDLTEELNKDQPRLYDSDTRQGIVPRLRDYLQTLRTNNLSDNPSMARLASQIDEKLILSTETLKKHKWVRSQTADEASNILKSFAGFGQRFLDEPTSATA